MSSAPSERKVFVGGLPLGVDQSTLRDDFLPYGDIDDVFLPTDRATGQLRGFAFVTFKDGESAHKAAGAMHNRDYHGRVITVNIAKPREGDGGRGSGAARRPPNDYSRASEQGLAYRQEPRGAGPRERSRSPERGADRYAPQYAQASSYAPQYAQAPQYSHGHSYDGSGRYGDRDTRPRQAYYD